MINPFWCRDSKVCCLNAVWRVEFAREYITATKTMATMLLQQETTIGFNPIAFMLRHSIELVLKNEMMVKCWKSHQEMVKCSHKLWELVNSITCQTELRDYIEQDEILVFDKYDPDWFEFRYPEDKKQNPTRNWLCCFWLDDTITLCDKLIDFLDTHYPLVSI